MHILIAPNAFKNSLDAVKAAEAIEKGLLQSKLHCTATRFPVADGGDGTGALLSMHLGAERIPVEVLDPLGRKIESSFGLTADIAIIELADASGLRLLYPDEYDPLRATTYGTGQLIMAAIDKKVNTIILCIGGSATVDGGAGILRATGVKFLDKVAIELDGSPASMSSLAFIDNSGIDKRVMNTRFIILCDVTNTLLGSSGAAAIFGPQKGASPPDVKLLNYSLSRFRDIALTATGKDMAVVKHGGAAGGVSAGLYALLNAQLVNGIDQFLQMTGFANELAKADLVITGEGSLDKQTLEGKGPFGVAQKAKQLGMTVIGMAGKVTNDSELDKYFDKLLSINKGEVKLEVAILHTYDNLVHTARAVGEELANAGNHRL